MSNLIDQNYRDQITADIHDCIEEMQCRPILFVGAGLSRRYLDLPDWKGLLDKTRLRCPSLDKELPYYLQRSGNLPAVATEFSAAFQEFAWTSTGRKLYPAKLFTEGADQDVYFKYAVQATIEELSSSEAAGKATEEYLEELNALKGIRPFGLITTNYDTFLESLFPQFQVTIGEAILRSDLNKIGDLLKIHGCVTRPETLVITEGDYHDYITRQRYLSAKLLTYFLEHPIVFVGYSVNDENIRELLSHIDLILHSGGECIANIYILNRSFEPESIAQREAVLPTVDSRHVRVKQIATSDFEWVFLALGHQAPVELDVSVLRAMESMVHRLVRTEISNGSIDVDYQAIASLVSGQTGRLTVVGLTPLVDLAQAKAHYRHTITAVAGALGYSHWYKVNELFKKIEDKKGIAIKSYDNLYHQATNYGKSIIHEYSDDLIELLKLVQSGNDYEVKG